MIKSLKTKRSLSLLTSLLRNPKEEKVYKRINSVLSSNETKSTKSLKKGIEDNLNFLKKRIEFSSNQILKHNKCKDNALKEHLGLTFKQENIEHDRIHILPSQIPIIKANINKLREQLIETFNQTKQYEIEKYSHMEQLIYLKEDLDEYDGKVNALIKETNYLRHEVKSIKQNNSQLIMKLAHNKKKTNFLKDIAKLILTK